MTDRITTKQLERVVAQINSELGVPNEPYADARDERGGLIANVGNVHLAGAYSGTRLEQMCDGGGSRDFLSTGYATKRAVYDVAQAWLAGRRSAAK
jgi:hypothetical protein